MDLELGPMPIREVGQKLAKQVTQERLTVLDQGLLKFAEENFVDVGTMPKAGESWTRRLDIERLKVLSKMGLAEKQSPSIWKLARNHAAFWDGRSLELTPAYDICPQVRTNHEVNQAMLIKGQVRQSKLVNVLDSVATINSQEKKVLLL